MRRWAAALAGAWLVSSCATYTDKTEAARAAVEVGNLGGGVKEINRYLKVRKSDDLPTKWKKDTALAVLERATILHAMGELELSKRDFQVADEQLVLLDVAGDTAGQIGKYIFSDDATKYKAPPSEKLALNAFNMLNYLALQDLSGARVEAKRFSVMREYLTNFKPGRAHAAFGSYVAGFVHERLGEYGPAMRYYDEALQERPFQGLRAPIQRLAAETPVRGERVKALLGEQGYAPVTGPSSQPVPTDTSTPPTEAAPVEPAPSDAPPPTATLAAPTPTRATLPALAGPPTEILVFVNLGRVPYKIPQRLPIGLAVGLAGTYITGDIRVLEHTAFKFVNYPKLVSADNDYTRGSVTIDGAAVPLELASNLEAEVAAEYEELLPKIIGAAITRMITRAIAAEGARAAGRQSEGAGALVGFLAAAVTEGALTAADKPDTRSWTMLPAQVYIARAAVTPGKHAVVVDVGGPGGRENRRYDVDVSSGGFVVLDITTLR